MPSANSGRRIDKGHQPCQMCPGVDCDQRLCQRTFVCGHCGRELNICHHLPMTSLNSDLTVKEGAECDHCWADHECPGWRQALSEFIYVEVRGGKPHIR